MEKEITYNEADYQKEKRKKVAKPLLWFGMVSIVMLFAGLTSAVIVRKGDGEWLQYDMPSMFLVSCFVILSSSLFLVLSNYFAKNNNSTMVKGFIGLTLLSGFAFIYTQILGYEQLVEQRVFFTGDEHNASGSFLYIISWLHLAHLFGGIISLLIVFFNALKDRYNSENLLGLQLCSMYWHFLGGMWIYLYLFFRMII